MNPKLLGLAIFSKNMRNPDYQIQAIDYSILFKISLQSTLEILKSSNFDYEKFCQLRDKSKHILDEF